MKPTARRRLGKYVLLGRLGQGGMGKIYLAHAPGPAGIDKLLVVKRLHSHLTADPILVNSFLDEARLSMALNHPNIVHTYDVGEVDGRYFMVMEYIDGQNLGVVLRTAKRSGQYPKSTTWAGLFLSVLDGLHAAHVAKDARGRPLQIIHRDVSPQNILVTYEGLPKLVDFGIAKAALRVGETDAGTLKGKYAYMSPEQVRGEPLDARSDVFAAGIVLWEMLAGRRLYKADTIVRSVERILQEPVVSPQRVNAECDAGLAKVVLKALQKDKEDRYASAEEMKDALEDALAASGHRYRPSEARELMQRLFKDVIEKQRAVLESSLNQSADAADDDDDARHRPNPDGDSQSDLRMPQLNVVSEGESTTPSSARKSPLVTAEGDVSRSVTRPPPPIASASVGGPAALSAPPSSPSPGSAASTDASAIAATATGPFPPPQVPARRRSVLVPLAALLGGAVLAVLGVVVADRVDRGRTPQVAHGASGTAPSVVADAGVLVAASPDVVKRPLVEPPPTLVVDAGVVPEPRAGPDAGVAPEPPPAPPPAPAVATLGDDDDKGSPARSRRRPRVRPADKPPERAPAPAEEKPAEVAGEGYLTLDTVPWTTVYLGKRKLGETPLVKVPVPAGSLELSLVNAEAGIKEAYFANVKPGGEFRARLDMR